MSDFFGIDVGVGGIRIVSLNREAKSIVVESLGETKVADINWLKDGGKGVDQIAGAIRMLLNDMKLKAKKVVVSIPEEEVISRLVRLPPMKENEIRDALKFEAETFVPYPLDQVSMDYEVVEVDESGRLLVFAIAAKNDLIGRYVKMFKSLGLELLALESPAIAMKRVVDLSLSFRGSLMIVDMGERYSGLISMNDGKVYFTRAMAVGGESLTRAISINLGLDMASAEEYKKAYGMKEMELEGKIKNSILPVFNSMAEEVRRAMVAYREEWGKTIELLVLSGGGANMPGLAEEFTKLLGVEVQVIQPFQKIDTTRTVMPVNVNTEGCRFALAIGLALRGLT